MFGKGSGKVEAVSGKSDMLEGVKVTARLPCEMEAGDRLQSTKKIRRQRLKRMLVDEQTLEVLEAGEVAAGTDKRMHFAAFPD